MPRFRASHIPLVLLAAALLAIAATVGEAKDKLPRIKRTAEFKYVDATDDDEAALLLPKLLKKYDTPKKCEGLLKILRSKRSYPSRMPGRLTLEHVCTDGKPREFTVLQPSKYSKRKPTGVLIFLHGAVGQPSPGGGAYEAGMFAPAVRRLNLIVIGPSTYDRVGWDKPACRDLVHHALDFVKQHYNVDENRVFIAGDSDGGRGTYVQLETEATFIASAVPVIGSPGSVTRFVNFKNVPIFAINGETDTIFDVAHVRQMVEGMKAAGVDITYKELAGRGHVAQFFLEFKDEVCDFFEANEREPFPKVVHWQVDTSRKDFDGGFPADTFRWIRIDEAGSASSRHAFEEANGSIVRRGLPRIEAGYEENRVEVKVAGVKRYSVLVSPDMLDLSKEIEVHTNGKLSFRGTVEANARVVLEEARRFKDRQLLFVNRIEVEVDATD